MKNPHKTRKVQVDALLAELCSSALVRRLFVLFHFCSAFFAPQSVYGLQNDVRTHSPTHIPAPEAKQPTEEELQEQVRRARRLLAVLWQKLNTI